MSTNGKKIIKALKNMDNLGVFYSVNIQHNSIEDATLFVNEKIEFYRDLKSKSICVKCGNLNVTFHHINKDTKIIDISEMIHSRRYFTLNDVIEELKKCVPMCIDCHIREEIRNLKK